MAMRVMDGFEESVMNRSRWPAGGGSVTQSLTYGRLGGKGVRLGDNTASGFGKTLVINDDTLIYAFAFRLRDGGGTNYVLNAFGAGGDIEDGGNDSMIGISNINGNSAADYFTPPGTIVIDTWHWIVMKVRFDNTLGSVGIWVDGVQYVDASGVDTNPAPAFTNLQFGGSGSGDTDEWWCDDVMILDGSGTENNDVPPESRVFTSFPDGNGATSDLTGSDGNQINNFEQVNSDPVNLTTWNESATDGDLDTYAMEDAALTGDVLAVQVETLSSKDDAGLKFGKNVVRSGGTNYPDSSFALAASPTWGYALSMYDVDPDTSIPWTVGGVDAVETGFQVSDT